MADNPEIPASDLIPIDKTQKHDEIPSKRNAELLKQWAKGVNAGELSQQFGISSTRCYAIINRWKHVVKIEKEKEKLERFRRLKRAELKASDEIAPTDCDQLVKVLEAQRKELEGDPESSNSNGTTNIQVNIDSINTMDTGQLIESIRSMLGR